jgi:geranylgeranyl pyrophosphate synthase
LIVSRDFERSVIELGVFERRAKSLALFIDRVLEGDPSLPDACRQFVRGGKRLRARLVLACAAPSGKLDSEPLLRAAAAIEFFHAASLIHDDIVDRSETRRGAPVMHRALGVRGASLGGWYLGQLAFALMAELPHTARQRFAEAGQAMSRGQLAEIVRAGDLSLLPEDRIEIMDQKTAAVFGLACELGGALSGADTVDCARLRHLGESFGMLFQIADDVDDLYASREELGRALQPRTTQRGVGCPRS